MYLFLYRKYISYAKLKQIAVAKPAWPDGKPHVCVFGNVSGKLCLKIAFRAAVKTTDREIEVKILYKLIFKKILAKGINKNKNCLFVNKCETRKMLINYTKITSK